MTVAEESLRHADEIDTLLRELIAAFEHFSLDERLKHSKMALDAMETFFEEQDLIIRQVLKDRPDYQPEFEIFETAHKSLLETYEDLVLMHVEEPDYYSTLRFLQQEFSIYAGEHYKQFMSKVQADLSKADEHQVNEQILLKK